MKFLLTLLLPVLASNSVSEMIALAKPYSNVTWHSLDFDLAQKVPRSDDAGAKGGIRHERELYESLIRASDVVIRYTRLFDASASSLNVVSQLIAGANAPIRCRGVHQVQDTSCDCVVH